MKRVVVVGAGPVGVVTAIGLARRGHAVTVVDRDPGPPRQGTWTRSGVGQFRHPHGFRPTVHAVLSELMPDVWATLVDVGCVPGTPPGAPPGTVTLRARRSTFERGMRRALSEQPGVQLVVGQAEEIVIERSRLAGVRVSGRVVEADLVVVATGRAGRLGDPFRAEADGGPCGLSYTSRMYRGRPGTTWAFPAVPMAAAGDGYLSIVFPQDDNTLSALVVRPTTDVALAQLRHNDVFDAVAAAIPNLAPWVDPARSVPITDAMAGGGLANSFRSGLDVTGRCAVPGLFFVGDAVLTTNPQAGRGIATGLQQVRALLRLLAEHPDPADVAVAFDAWCVTNLRPWFTDHVHWDATLLRRWAGHDLDLQDRIPSDVVCAAADVDPRIKGAAMAYGAMAALPHVLDPFQEITRALLRTGWRPPLPTGPSRDDLAGLVDRHRSVAPAAR